MRSASRYSKEFKQAAIKKVLNRGERTIEEIRQELGVPLATLSGWVYGNFGSSTDKVAPTMSKKNSDSQNKGNRAQDYSAQAKLQTVLEFKKLQQQPQAQGEYLRSQGLHAATLDAWENEVLAALEKTDRKTRRSAEEVAKDQKIVQLERDLRRKEKALAEATALLVLKKKAELIWGLVDDEESA